jgi:hypothetical protein
VSVRLTNVHTAFILLVVAALAVAGCGEDESMPTTTAPAVTGATEATDGQDAPGTEDPTNQPAPDPATDREAIAATLAGVLTGREPGVVCDELVTERYLQRSYGGRTGCEKAQSGANPAERTRVSRIVILPDAVAQAAVTPVGGVYDGERLRAELVLDEGVWRLDWLRSNVPVGP